MFDLLKALWSYRRFIISSIRNEFKTRFSRSVIGGFWMILNPLAQVAIYALILSAVLSAKLPGIDNQYAYAIYLTSGILAWSLFEEIVNRCLNLFISQGDLMKKIMFPRITLPTIVVGSSLLNNIMLFASILVIFALLGHFPTVQILWLPLLTLIVVSFALGLGLILGVLNVFVRDVGQIVPICLQVGFWFTPIVYPIDIVPPAFKPWLGLNPMFPLVRGYQDVLVYGVCPDMTQILIIAGTTIPLILLGLFVFRRASAEMMDVL